MTADTRSGTPEQGAPAQPGRQRVPAGAGRPPWGPRPVPAPGGTPGSAGPAVAALAGCGTAVLAARSLDADAAGAFFAGTAVFGLCAAIGEAGSGAGLVHFIKILRSRAAPPREFRRCLRTALLPLSAVALATAAILWSAAPVLSTVTGHGEVPGYLTLLRVVALLLPLGVLSDALLAATRGWPTGRPTAVLEQALRPGTQLVLFSALSTLALADPALFTLSWLAPYLLTVLLGWYTVHRLIGALPVRAIVARTAPEPARDRYRDGERGRDLAAARVFWRGAAARTAAGVTRAAWGRVDLLVLAGMVGLRAVAVFAVASRFILLGRCADEVVTQAVRPRLAQLLDARDRDGVQEMYQAATGWLVAATWPLYLLLAALPSFYVGLFGSGYRLGGTAGRAVTVLACAMLVRGGCGLVGTVLAAAGHTGWNRLDTVVAVAVTLAVDVALIPRHGALGAAIGLAAGILAYHLIPLVQVAVLLRLHPFGAGTWAAALAALLCFGGPPLLCTAMAAEHLRVAGLGIGDLLAASPGTVALATTGAGAAAYAAALHRLRRLLRFDAFVALRQGRSANK